jgi:spermine oxidase
MDKQSVINTYEKNEDIFSKKHKYDVIIIGSGAAGCEAARKLYDSGMRNILILEARDRLGGRINTIHLNDDINMPIEWGANWIHGIVVSFLGSLVVLFVVRFTLCVNMLQNNPLYNLVKENANLFYHDKEDLFSEEAVYCVDENGKKYDSEACHEMYDLYRKLMNAAKDFAGNKQKCPYQSYEEYMYKMLDVFMIKDDADKKEFKKALLRRLLKQEQIEHGCSTMREVSLKDYGFYVKLPGPDYEFPGGFSKLINFLVDNIPKSCIKLSHAVETILPNSDFTEVEVTCLNGEAFVASHVLVTCPLNYLKKYHAAMMPNLLNERKINAISQMHMGTTDKIFLVYDECDGGMEFFPKDVNTIHPINLKDDHQAYDVFQWQKKVFSFDKVYDNVLMVWATGDEAIYIESLDDNTVAKELTKLLRNFLQNDQIPLPSKLIR